jgi:hypothetical protein
MEKTMNKQEIEKFLEVNKINAKVYEEDKFERSGSGKARYVFSHYRISTPMEFSQGSFQIEKRDGAEMYSLSTGYSNQEINAEFIEKMNALLLLVKLLNK